MWIETNLILEVFTMEPLEAIAVIIGNWWATVQYLRYFQLESLHIQKNNVHPNVDFKKQLRLMWIETNLRLEVFTMEPLELIAVIFELVSNDKVLGEIGPDRFIPWVVPPEYVNSWE